MDTPSDEPKKIRGKAKCLTHTDKAKALGIGRKTYYEYAKKGMPKDGAVREQAAWVAAYKGTPVEFAPGRDHGVEVAATPTEGGEPAIRTWADRERRARIAKTEMQTEIGRQKIVDAEREAVTAEARAILAEIRAAMAQCCGDCRTTMRAALDGAAGE